MNRTLSFLSAATLGATLGAFSALEVAPYLGLSGGIAATFGVLIGAITGYVTVDFNAFINGVKTASGMVFAAPAGMVNALKNRSNQSKRSGRYITSFVFWLCVYSSCFAYLTEASAELYEVSIFGLLMFCLLSLSMQIFTFGSDEGDVDAAKTLASIFSPITILSFVFLTALPFSIKSLATFARHLFITVHSERRALCSVDAMLGTLIGYYAGSWLIGAAAGLALGIVSYELVSKRILKIAV